MKFRTIASYGDGDILEYVADDTEVGGDIIEINPSDEAVEQLLASFGTQPIPDNERKDTP